MNHQHNKVLCTRKGQFSDTLLMNNHLQLMLSLTPTDVLVYYTLTYTFFRLLIRSHTLFLYR